MKELSLSFFPKACNLGEVTARNLITDLYCTSFLNLNSVFEDGEPAYLPSKQQILMEAWDCFESYYIPYILNGHGGSVEEDYRRKIEVYGLDWTIDDMEEVRSYNAGYGYGIVEEEGTMKKYLLDLSRMLDHHHFSYMDDGFNIITNDHTLSHQWRNPAIVKVW